MSTHNPRRSRPSQRVDLERANTSTLLWLPFHAFIAEIHDALAAAGYPDIHPAHGTVFRLLDAEGTRLTDLAQRAQTTKQAIAYSVDALEARGYLERVPDPTDGRARLIRLTRRGEELTRVTEGIIDQVESGWAARFGAERLQHLRGLLRELSVELGA